ncbi:MAG: VanZ family protein [Lachnospiraceae bacterium]|nr:VanZ family protein [Lachnospiraceae bacterium]
MTTNYLIKGVQTLKCGVLAGISVYLIIVILLYILKIRRGISRKCIFEMLFCIYVITLLKITGIFSLNYSLSGHFSYSLVPFINSSIIPVLLNFILFVPYGLLLPIVFRSCRWNWKKIVFVCGFTSLIIELLQLLGGRYAEIDDFLINALGAFSGFIIYSCIKELKKNRKRAAISFASLCFALIICFAGIYCIGGNAKQLPDGLNAVENAIAEVNVYFNGEKQSINADSYIYHSFASQISNCGGHLLETESISENMIWNNDCFIEIIYSSPQQINFENTDDFSIDNADRILYNANQNILYWGNSEYQSCMDYTKIGEELQPHKEEILKQYEQLPGLIISYFEQ